MNTQTYDEIAKKGVFILKTIFAMVLNEQKNNRGTVLVTIVDEEGSAPRGTGSQMLVGESGRISGTIGGGAVEKRSEELAMRLLEQKQSLLHRFELRKGAESDIGMVCGGDVTVWFQYIPADDESWAKVSAAAMKQYEDGAPAWLVLKLDGAGPSLIDADGSSLAGAAPDETGLTLAGCARKAGLFSMPLPVGERIVIFGGGHIAQALAPLVKKVGFRPVIFDCREEYASADRFPDAEQIICGDYMKISDYLVLNADDYVVIMTNGHAYDFEVEDQVLRTETAYVGVIGSRSKTAAVNQRLRERGISEEILQSVHTPIGTPIRAVTPEEIAVSITGELIYERAIRREGEAEAHHACPMH